VQPEAPDARRKRIVIVGAGFAGVAAARALKRCDADVVVIDRRNHHIFQPLLYQVATAVLAPSEIAAPIRQLAYMQKNVSVMLGEVTGVDLAGRSVDVSCPDVGMRKVPFDYLVIGPGMRPSYFGHDEFAKYAPGLKSLADAESIRARILSAYERADATDDECQRARELTFVLVGGGPTGVELAASMAQLATTTLRAQFRRIDPASSSIILVEGSKRILPTFAESLAKRATRRLEKLGVEVLTGVKVEAVDEKGVGRPIPRRAGFAGCVRRRRRIIGQERRAAGAGRGAGGHPAGTLCRTPDRAAAQGPQTRAALPLSRQGQHGCRRQELRHPGKRTSAHQRLSHVARLGISARHVASPGAEPVAGADAVVLVVFHRPARRAIDPGARRSSLRTTLTLPHTRDMSRGVQGVCRVVKPIRNRRWQTPPFSSRRNADGWLTSSR
jgi:thioredoxin reductase